MQGIELFNFLRNAHLWKWLHAERCVFAQRTEAFIAGQLLFID